MMRSLKLLSLFLALVSLGRPLHADATAGAPPAQRILVITGSAGFGTFPSFQNFMQQSGAGGQWNYCTADMNGGTGFITEMQVHTVTFVTSVPSLATLSTYDQVWDMRFANDTGGCTGCCTAAGCGLNQITAGEQANYLSYIAGGGSLMLMGDNGGFSFRNNPIIAIAQAVDNLGTWGSGGILTNNDATHQGAYINVAGAAAAENFATDYRNLTGANNWIAAQYNGMVANWGSGYKVLEDFSTGDAVATAWDCGNMKNAYKSGKLFIVLDWQIMGGDHQVNYCGPATLSGTTNGFNERFWENMVDYLVPGNVCSTPTFTPTRTSTATPTMTRTITPTSTATPSRTVTPTSTDTVNPSPTSTSTATPTATSTRTNTPTFTSTVTPSFSSTATPSRTVTPTYTATITVSDTNTPGPTATNTVTRSNTPTNTPSFTQTVTLTSTPTYSVTPSSTSTRTVTPTFTSTSTVTETSLFTSTNTPTSTATPSITVTRSSTATPSATRTVTDTYTQTPSSTFTVTWSNTPTVSDTPTATPTVTASATRTVSPTQTVSFTASATPIPVPHKVRISLYNSAGELVKLLFDGGAQYLPGALGVDADVVPGGAGVLHIQFPGTLYDPALGGSVSSIVWAADNDAGQLVKGGVYTIKAEIVDNFGQVTTLQHSVQVVDVAPKNSLYIYNSAGEVVAQLPLPNTGSGSGNSRYDSLKLASDSFGAKYDESGQLVGGLFTLTLTDEQGNSATTTWDGRNAQGIPVKSGNYIAELVYNVPGSGGRRVIESKSFVVIQAGEGASLAGAFAAPNPALHGQDLLLFYPVSSGYSCVARLYTLAGELVSEAEDRSQSGQLRFSTDNVASGVYCAKLEKLSGGAVAARTTVKVAIVR